jgi:translation initiation factor IF-2
MKSCEGGFEVVVLGAMKAEQEEKLKPRPPVVAVVGHVDHGKSSLLDFIRKTNTVAKEAGGITQSIGAYEIEHSGKKITFIDTPGHEAFSKMRAHGTAAADLAILVVAADDGVKPQTLEAIEILKKTQTPFIVALSKIDKPNADPQRAINQLLEAGVLLEGYGGDISWQKVSAVSGEGINELLDLILLAGEVNHLTYNPEAIANGFVLESKKDSRRGIIAHLVLKDGVLREGDEIVTPSAAGKVKILENFLGEREKELYPSAPALVVGFETLPEAGEEFWAGKLEVNLIGVIRGEKKLEPRANSSLSAAPVEAAEESTDKLRVILKADTSGSLEALRQILGDLVEVKDASLGDISDGDVGFAKSTGSLIVGFKSRVSKPIARLADSQAVKIVVSDVIYQLLETVIELSRKKEQEEEKGALQVLAIFSVSQSKQTIGGRVVAGRLRLGDRIAIERAGEVISQGKIISLQSAKQPVRELVQETEGGLIIETGVKIEVGDLLKVI